MARSDRHHPRGVPADLNHNLAAVPGDGAAAQRHQLTGAQPSAGHHHGHRRGAFGRVTLGGRDSRQLATFGFGVRRRWRRARKRRRPLPRPAVHWTGEPVQH